MCRKLSEVMENQRKASRWQLPDFMRRLEAKVDVRELTCNEFPKPMLHMVCKNAMNSVRNMRTQFQEEELQFVYYELEMTEKTRQFFIHEKEGKFESYYIVFEEHTGYIWSNCNRLFLELIIEQGVNEEDMEDEGLNYLIFYQLCLERYIREYRKKPLLRWMDITVKGGQVKIQSE